MVKFLTLSFQDVMRLADRLAVQIIAKHGEKPRVYPVARGGVPVALALKRWLPACHVVEDPAEADVIVDDVIDSGGTADKFGPMPFYALMSKCLMRPHWHAAATARPDEWIVFPWESSLEHSAEDIPTRLLQYIGENTRREGLRETPQRFLQAWTEWTSGYNQKPEDVLKVFDDGGENYDELVLVSNIPVHSKCEHHLADIFGVAHVGYIPDRRIVGLSKVARLVDIFARRLQVQERMTTQIADSLAKHLQPRGVGVVLQCRHMCMESRGVVVQGSITTTSAMRGALLTKPEARGEFLRLVDGARNGTVI